VSVAQRFSAASGLRVGFDIDGVLADFRHAFRRAAQHALGRAVDDPAGAEGPDAMTAGDMKRVWDAIARTPQWWLTLQAYEPAEIARLFAISRERRWEVYFMTTRPPSAGETPQFQTQWWLESNGFHLPSVLTVPGSRGELANALRLDVFVDDQVLNCVDVIAASKAKAICLMRDNDVAAREQALGRGIAVVPTLREAVGAVLGLEEALRANRGRVARLAEWFRPKEEDERLPVNPRGSLPLPKVVP
jgi:hypothetical protein